MVALAARPSGRRSKISSQKITTVMLCREASPTAAVIDSQTVKSAEKGAVTMAA
jgi:hypothetical protein